MSGRTHRALCSRRAMHALHTDSGARALPTSPGREAQSRRRVSGYVAKGVAPKLSPEKAVIQARSASWVGRNKAKLFRQLATEYHVSTDTIMRAVKLSAL